MDLEIMPKNELNDSAIDVVIMWVDGNDKNWQQKINKYSETTIDFNDKEQSVRYNSIGEIDIAIKSIIKYAPFVRNVFLVTDNQKPINFDDLRLLASEKKIKLSIVDHTVIFRDYEEFLPCFNSRSIASVLHRIPDLSEHFLIFNDDTFLMRNTKISDFFIDGYPVLRGEWKKFYEDQVFRKLYYKCISLLGFSKKKKKRAGFKKAMQLSAKMAGASKYIRRLHTPIPIRKSTILAFFKNNELLKSNIQHKFRSEDQFLIESLSNHLEIENKTYHYLKDTQLTYFRSYKKPKKVQLKLENSLNDTSKLFITFQSLEMADTDTLMYILDWIENRLN